MPKSPPPENTSVEEKLDEILEHLRNIDKRDRLRMIGGFFRFLIALIPILILLWSIWYTFNHGADLMKAISEQAAQAAAKYTQNQGGELYQQLLDQVQGR